jgi:aldehyde:ferredoxin oxidoreductase
MRQGYMGKMLFVDLTKGTIKQEAVTEKMKKEFMGGYGFGSRIIYERMKGKVDALSPASIVGFLTGPLTGTPAPTSGRFVVVGKSPLTGTWGDANCGGDFGPYMKFAGVDGIFVTGKSAKPVYLYVENDKAQLKDAGKLWGKDCLDTEDMLKASHGAKTSVACIGPSGENLSLISCVVNDKGRAAGRSGVGALMGAKNLKAIAVQGDMKIPMADEEACKEARRKWIAQINRWYHRRQCQ